MTTQVTAGSAATRIDGNAATSLVGGAAPVVFIGGTAYIADNHPILTYYKLNPTVYAIATGATAPATYTTAVAADRGQSGMVGGPEIDGYGNVPVYPRFP